MKKLIVAMILIIGLGGMTNAQKLGHIDSQQLFELMPEKADAMAKLEENRKGAEDHLMGMQQKNNQLLQEYQTMGQVPEAVRKAKENEIIQLQQNMQEFEYNAQQELSLLEAKLLQPIIDRAREAVEAVAQANGYTYVFDSSTGATVYAAGDDLLPMVLKQLNITPPPAE